MEQLGFYVCDPDLEAELIRALGPDAVEAVLEAQKELGSFRTFQRQPAQRERPVEKQLQRFMGHAKRAEEPVRASTRRRAGLDTGCRDRSISCSRNVTS